MFYFINQNYKILNILKKKTYFLKKKKNDLKNKN